MSQDLKNIQEIILELENYIETAKNNLKKAKSTILYLKDILWDKEAKKESSKMYKVLKDDKSYTQVKSNIGNIKVDKNFMEKEIKKHLDNPNFRGMVTTEEMLSFPKVAKNVKAQYNDRQQGHNWSVKTNDEVEIVYGERDYGERHRLLTTHSKTERDERGQLRQEFNDRDFHNSALNEIIPQNNENKIRRRR